MLGEDSIKWNGDPKRRGSEICKRKHYSSLNHICNYFQSIYTRIYLLRLCQGQIYLDKSSPFLFDDLLKSILTIKSFIRAQFSNPLSTNSLYWAQWAWIESYLGLRIQNMLLHYYLRGFPVWNPIFLVQNYPYTLMFKQRQN